MKKLVSLFLFCLFSFNLPLVCLAETCDCVTSTENLANPKSKAPSSEVDITEDCYILVKGNVIKVAFDCKFLSECASEGDEISFYVPKDICTNCGTVVLPMNSKFVGYVRGITKQKMLNKNARVYISLNKLVLPDDTELEVKAKPFTKDFSLVENGWMTAGKLTAYTVGLGGVGTCAGAGLAFIPKPHKIAIGAAAIGLPVGCFIGLVTGLVTPGLKYHAKAGEEIYIILCDDLSIPKDCVDEF